MGRLAAEVRRYRNESPITTCLEKLLGPFGDVEHLANYWRRQFEVCRRRWHEDPEDRAAEKFVTDTLFSFMALDEAAQRREERYTKILLQMERLRRKNH